MQHYHMESLIIRCIEKFVKWIDLSLNEGIFLLFLCDPFDDAYARSTYNFILSETLSATSGNSPLQYGQDASSDSDDHIDSSHTAKQNSFHMAELLDLWLFLLSRWPARTIQCTAIWQGFISILFQSSHLFFIKLHIGLCCQCCIWH